MFKMFKIFRNIGLISLMFLSFIYTEKLVSVVKEYDEIMIEIKNNESKYKIDSIDAIIEENTIIPGIKGKKIDINKSYSKMKQYGKYDERLLTYEEVLPSNLLENNKDKFIISGPNKNKVSLIFLVNNKDNIDNIIKILGERKVNFFIDNNWANKNEQKIIDLIKQGYIFGNLNYNNKTDNLIKKIAKQNNSYCYTEEKNESILKNCLSNYTIVPNIIIKNNTLLELKKNLKNGSIISISNIDETVLKLMINYIESKGYEIVNLEKLFEES